MFEQDFKSGYLELHKTGELKQRGKILWGKMGKCDLCPRLCGANRLDGERGICGADSQLEISSAHPHFGEERCLVGDGGSGTVFLTHCNLKCVFCINWDISHGGIGSRSSLDEFADVMLELQKMGCSNINISADSSLFIFTKLMPVFITTPAMYFNIQTTPRLNGWGFLYRFMHTANE